MKKRLIVVVLGLSLLCMAASTLIDLAHQVKGVLPTANGGTGTAGVSLALTDTAANTDLTASNTTAAVVGTSQGSPVMALCGTAFHASASAQDCMTFSELPGNGNDAAIAFNLAHTGTSTGTVTLNLPQIVVAGNSSVNSASSFVVTTKSRWTSPSDGVWTATPNAGSGNAFTRLNFGGTTSSFPAFGVNGTIITSQLADGTAGGLFLPGGSTVRVGASGFTTAANTNLQTITGLSWSFPATGTVTASFECDLTYSQATANAAVAFGIQTATAAATNVYATGTEQITVGPPATSVSGTLATLASTTATSIVSGTPGATATNYTVHLGGTIENTATTANVINVMVSTATSADAVTVLRGSNCTLK